jgi:3-phenylpropionate/cinnamic acid dioxygenase small subunit
VAEPVTHQPMSAAGGSYHAVLHFYARQMQLLDDGAIDEWAGTYTEDATFGSNAMPAPLAGRDAIRRGAREHDNLRQAGTRRRHLMSNLSIVPGEDGTVRATSYVTIVETREGTTALRFSTLLEDELVREDGEWLVRTRRIKRDDLG